MSSRSLPPRPNLAQLKLQANELRRAHREGKSAAAARIAAHHPRTKGRSLKSILERPLTVADAQLVLAREYGFGSWAQLKHRVELADRLAKFQPHPRFDAALAALDAGDLEGLRQFITSEPALVHARCNLEPPYGYFTGATLLHHVAGNPGRDLPLPQNVVDIARLLLDTGADVNASTLGPNGGTTMGLIITSKQASDRGFSAPLMELLLERGATLDLKNPGLLDLPLANHAPRAAEEMIALGAKPDVCVAAALGRMDLLRGCFDEHGRLRFRPSAIRATIPTPWPNLMAGDGRGLATRRRSGKMAERDAIGLAMLFAYVNKRLDAVDFLLEKDGNWNMIGVNNGTALHRAAWWGDLAMVQRLVAKGADLSNRDNPFTATPLSWAHHNQQQEIVRWMSEHCAIDLHDAVAFDMREQVLARLREDPASVNKRIDQWGIAQGVPLHWAAAQNREALAKLLMENGADPNILAGNGLTPLDVAEEKGAADVARLIEQNGGRRAAEL